MKLFNFVKCPKCGQRNKETSKHCTNCGYQLIKDPTVRTATNKCPYCGEAITRNDLKCPSCGREIARNVDKMNEELDNFTAKLLEYDRLIDSGAGGKTRKGYSSWSSGGKVGWVFLNIFFVCIPLIVYTIVKSINLDGEGYLNAIEREKLNYIKNYSFDRHKSNIVNFMLVIESNLNSLLNDNSNSSFAFANVWKNKAKQVKQSSNIDDERFDSSYYECMMLARKIKNKKTIKAVLIILLCLGIVAFFVIYYIFFYDKQGVAI